MSTSPTKDGNDEVYEPIIIDLGKHKKKSVKQLRQGKSGKLIDDVQGCLEELRSNNVISDAVKPVIIVVREKQKSKKWGW
jgi:hypothetical protein|tara:strand:+ start:262 stop:501 length:240 start_codon:yes stop_codon:yes gene_type:complete